MTNRASVDYIVVIGHNNNKLYFCYMVLSFFLASTLLIFNNQINDEDGQQEWTSFAIHLVQGDQRPLCGHKTYTQSH